MRGVRSGITAFTLVLSVTNPALGLEFVLPTNAVKTAERNSEIEAFAAPISVFTDGAVDMIEVEGVVERAAWRISSPGLTPLQVLRPIRAELQEGGYQIALDCAAQACGGYDFRFGLETLPAPAMFVNMRAYHHVTAVKGNESAPQEIVSILASTTTTAAYLQIIRAGQIDPAQATRVAQEAPLAQATPAERAPVNENAQTDLASALIEGGRAILTDIEFATGTTDLNEGSEAQLSELAAFISSRPDLSLALVGHTDSVGGLDGNISISRRRAAAVRDRLVNAHDVDGAQVDAQGMGYLAPIASNLTEDGREANRRVEVIVVRER